MEGGAFIKERNGDWIYHKMIRTICRNSALIIIVCTVIFLINLMPDNLVPRELKTKTIGIGTVTTATTNSFLGRNSPYKVAICADVANCNRGFRRRLDRPQRISTYRATPRSISSSSSRSSSSDFKLSSHLTIGIDCGTQSTKVVVLDTETQKVVGRGSRAYDILPNEDPRCAEQDVGTWIRALEEAVKDALDGLDSDKVKAISVSGQQHGFVPVDDGGHVIRPCKLWCDTTSSKEAEEIEAMTSPRRVIFPAFTSSKMLWMKKHEPGNFNRLSKCMLPHDYLNFYLTGKFVMEAGDASGTGLLDVDNKKWDAKLMAELGFEKYFPESLQDPNQKVGNLKPEVATSLGLPLDVIVAAGSGDNMMAALGAGAVESGRYVASLGTSGTIFCSSEKSVHSELISSFCDALGSNLPLVCTQNCATVPEEIRKTFGGGSMSRDEITELAQNEEIGCEGIVFIPYLNGERTPNEPLSSGVLYGIRPGMLKRPGLLYRAALEGVTFAIFEGYLEMVGTPPSNDGCNEANGINLVGGGSRNPLWRQIFADLFNSPVSSLEEAESAALGAALQAAAVSQNITVRQYIKDHPPKTSGDVVTPNMDRVARTRRSFLRWKKVRDQMKWENIVSYHNAVESISADQISNIRDLAQLAGESSNNQDAPSFQTNDPEADATHV